MAFSPFFAFKHRLSFTLLCVYGMMNLHLYFAVFKIIPNRYALKANKRKMDTIIGYLVNSKLFDGLTREEIADFYPYLNARVLNINKGMILIYPEDTVGFIGVLLSGELHASTLDIYGNATLFGKVAPLEIFAADIACAPEQKSPFLIQSAAPSEVLTFPYGVIAEESGIPEGYRCILLKNILAILAGNKMRELYRLEILSKKTLRERIILYLAFQAKRHGAESFNIPFNREELAEYLNADRCALSRELGNMQKDGLIRFKKNRFEIMPPFTTGHAADGAAATR